MPHISEIIKKLKGDSLPESWYFDMSNDICSASSIEVLQNTKSIIQTNLNNIWLCSKHRERVLRLMNYCKLRIELFKNK